MLRRRFEHLQIHDIWNNSDVEDLRKLQADNSTLLWDYFPFKMMFFKRFIVFLIRKGIKGRRGSQVGSSITVLLFILGPYIIWVRNSIWWFCSRARWNSPQIYFQFRAIYLRRRSCATSENHFNCTFSHKQWSWLSWTHRWVKDKHPFLRVNRIIEFLRISADGIQNALSPIVIRRGYVTNVGDLQKSLSIVMRACFRQSESGLQLL